MSDYKDDIILKGGLLISSLIGIEKRTTMDMDASIKNMLVQETKVNKAIKTPKIYLPRARDNQKLLRVSPTVCML